MPCRLAPSRAAACVRPQHLQRGTSPAIAAIQQSCRSITTTTTTTNSRTPTSTSFLSQQRTQLNNPRARSRFQNPSLRRRSYHSYDHPTPQSTFSPTERTILTAAYAHIPQHGFTQEALALGARDAGYLDISTNLLPDGVFSLIQWHLVSQREALADKARELFTSENEQGERLGVGRKVELLTWERLMGNKEVIGQWQQVSQFKILLYLLFNPPPPNDRGQH